MVSPAAVAGAAPVCVRTVEGRHGLADSFRNALAITFARRLAEDPRKGAAFRRWFGRSKVVDAEGRPLVVYHATHAEDFAVFERTYDVGFHFGTLKTAHARVGSEEGHWRIIPAFLRIERPFPMDDLLWWGLGDVLEALVSGGVVTPARADRAQLVDHELQEFVGRALARKGYDGIVYRNLAESKGRGRDNSWVVFRPEQVKGVFARRFNRRSDDFLDGDPDKVIARSPARQR